MESVELCDHLTIWVSCKTFVAKVLSKIRFLFYFTHASMQLQFYWTVIHESLSSLLNTLEELLELIVEIFITEGLNQGSFNPKLNTLKTLGHKSSCLMEGQTIIDGSSSSKTSWLLINLPLPIINIVVEYIWWLRRISSIFRRFVWWCGYRGSINSNVSFILLFSFLSCDFLPIHIKESKKHAYRN